MSQSVFTVETPVFKGALETLLDLIEEKKLFISDVSLAKVADDYIEYVKRLSDFPVAESAQFILIASTLLLIKSKSLLPNLSLTPEEEGSIHDLELRLKIYQRIRGLSLYVKEKFGQKILFERGDLPVVPVFSPDKSMNIESLLSAIRSVLMTLPKKDFLPKVVIDKVISLEAMIENLTKRVTQGLKMSFREFSGTHKAEKINIIIGFLAMLELVKQGIIAVSQEEHFEDITMETGKVSLPRYE